MTRQAVGEISLLFPNYIVPSIIINTMNHNSITAQPISPIPEDTLLRNLAVAAPNKDQSLRHLGIVGDTYTILLTGDDTDGRFCLIDMYIAATGYHGVNADHSGRCSSSVAGQIRIVTPSTMNRLLFESKPPNTY
jgi:hypothetical protein